MSAADKIAAARELIKPLTGHTPGQWRSGDVRFGGRSQLVLHSQGNGYVCEVRTPVRDHEHDYGALEANVSLIAAAPSLRDTVAALTDGWEAEKARADALAQEIERLRAALEPFALMDFPTTQDAWDAFYRQPGKTWISFDHIDIARTALGDAP